MDDSQRLDLIIRHGWSLLECDNWFLVLSTTGRPVARWRTARGAIEVAAAIVAERDERFKEANA